ncbi:MAG TPA: UbiA family prenyltransferase [Rhizomicrobium sp.]|nr:UbiA family prenyltransferase [Rhizomicrobium sp.]
MATILTLSLNDLSTQALGRRVEHVRDDPRIPLCVKLEGAVLRTGTTAELALGLVRRQPLMLFMLLGWMFLGASRFRERVAAWAALDPASLAYRRPFLAFLRREAAAGRRIILVARARPEIARAIANHLGLISDIVEVDPDAVEPGETIARTLCARFGSGDFDYAGFGPADIPIWRTARRSVIVAPSPKLLEDRIWNSQTADILCPDDRGSGRYVGALHPGRWLKNLLVFLPLLEAVNRNDLHFLVKSYLLFCAYCLIASASYVLNDLIDLMADRRHATKRKRVLATGRLSISRAAVLASLLMAAGFGLAAFLSLLLAGWLTIYLALSLSYSLWIKKTLILDTFALTGLYMHRVLAGALLAASLPSLWQMMFAGFFFFSLAMLTRYGELRAARLSGTRRATRARAYRPGDLDLLAGFGLASGYLSAFILAIYAIMPEAHALFRSPEALWNLWPMLIYWISRVWIHARRGRVPDDPILFALGDRMSFLVALGAVLVVLVALFAKLPLYPLI